MSKITLTDSNFSEEVLKSDKPVLVDFWAPWCGPCRVQGPIVEELAQEAGEAYKVAAMDVDTSPQTSQQYNILSIPTSMIFKGGKVFWQGIGVQQKDVLAEAIKKALGS